MFCDIHNHVLFGVDDGSQSIQESLSMLDQAVEAGIDTVCATSHVHADYSEKERMSTLWSVYLELKQEIEKRKIPVDLHIGCELYYTSEFPSIAEFELFRYDRGSSSLLVELPPTEAPMWFADIVFQLRMGGISVLLAHPERNAALMRNPKILASYLQAGVYTQLTAGSIAGRYGSDIKKFADRILRSGACTLVASDAHNTVRRPFSDIATAYPMVCDMLGTGIAKMLFDTHPRAVLRGDTPSNHELSPDQLELLLRPEKKKFFIF